MCWKRRKTNSSPFAFVRYANLKEAKQAIRSLNGVTIRDNNIVVKLADRKRKNNSPEEKNFNHKHDVHPLGRYVTVKKTYKEVAVDIQKPLEL